MGGVFFFFFNNLNPMWPMILDNMDRRVDSPLSGRRVVTKFCFVEDKHANLALVLKSIRLERDFVGDYHFAEFAQHLPLLCAFFFFFFFWVRLCSVR